MIRHEQSHLHVVALSHPGLSGKKNEDRYAVSAYRVSPEKPRPSLVAVVSDGIGGHRAGEVAAEMAVNVISHAIAESDARRPVNTLQEAVHQASAAISERARTRSSLQGMGATCACVWIIGDRLYTASIGDSRIYLQRGKTFRRLTTDHTWVQEAVEKGVITPAQAKSHPNIHVIRRYLGSLQPPNADVRMRWQGDESDTQATANQGVRLSAGDILLICTDGLTDLVTDEELRAVISGRDLQGEAQALIDLANSRGGHDNITVILIAVPSQKKNRPGRRIWPWILSGIVGLVLIVAVGWGLNWEIPQPGVGATHSGLPETTISSTLEMATRADIPFSNELTVTPAGSDFKATYTPWPTNTP